MNQPFWTTRDTRQFFILIAAAVFILGIVILPPLLVIGILVVIAIAWFLTRTPVTLPQVRWQVRAGVMLYGAEIIGVTLLLFIVSADIWQGEKPISRGEFSYLVGTGVVASEIYERTSSIPLWNPLMGSGGEPMLESPFSYVLNPLMFFPVLIGGPVGGANVAIGLHILLIGAGGWLLGHTLGLSMAGRVLLGVLIGSLGGTTEMIGTGFYQLGLSQAYIPLIYAGLFGTIYRTERRYIGLLAVGTYLLIAAGTYWFVLPTAISCAVMILFALPLRRDAFRRLMIAAVFILGISAVRLLPQAVHHHLIDHPWVPIRETPDDFFRLFSLYFEPNPTYPGVIHYHYMLPLVAFLVIIGARILVWRRVAFRWRVLFPAGLLIIFFVMWAQEGGDIFLWLRENIPLVAEWRYTPRMLTAGGVWLAVILAFCVDDTLRVLRRQTTLLWVVVVASVSIVAVGSMRLSVANWMSRVNPLERDVYNTILIHHLREAQPDGFMAVMTSNFFDYFPFYDTLTRAYYGNPDYRPHGVASTMGNPAWMQGMPSIAFNLEDTRWSDWADKADITSLTLENRQYSVWTFPDALPYAFTMPLEAVERRAGRTLYLSRPEVIPAEAYAHHVEWVEVWLPPQQGNYVLVIQETAYPGWQITVNGEAAQMESFGERLAVILPGDEPLHVVFRYVPRWLHLGALITVFANAALILYLAGFKGRVASLSKSQEETP